MSNILPPGPPASFSPQVFNQRSAAKHANNLGVLNILLAVINVIGTLSLAASFGVAGFFPGVAVTVMSWAVLAWMHKHLALQADIAAALDHLARKD